MLLLLVTLRLFNIFNYYYFLDVIDPFTNYAI
jgi:hypothetical protein